MKKILNVTLKKKELKTLLYWGFKNFRIENISKLTETLKTLGFSQATNSGISISLIDLKILKLKKKLIKSKKNALTKIDSLQKSGFISIFERFQKLISIWDRVTHDLKGSILEYFRMYDASNSIFLMTTSGARGTISQISQITGIRGLMADQSGNLIESPILSNFKEGLTITDFLISSYGARKGITDTALKTADAGYLTRKLIEATNHIYIQNFDCYTTNGIKVLLKNINDLNRLVGRTIARTIKIQRKIIIKKGQVLNFINLNELKQYDNINIIIRSPLTCNLTRFICQKCFGWNLSKNQLIKLGQNVGIIAAQSIGEPGLQLTMRTFHTGGILSSLFKKQLSFSSRGQIIFGNIENNFFIKTSKGEYCSFFTKKNFLIIETYSNKNIKIFLNKNILWFIKNKDFIKKNHIIGEIPFISKNITKKVIQKNIYSLLSGELQYPKLLNQNNLYRFLWIFFSDIYKFSFPIKIFLHTNKEIQKTKSYFKTFIKSNFYGIVKNIDTIKSNIEFFSRNTILNEFAVSFLYLNKIFYIIYNYNSLKFLPKLVVSKNNNNHILFLQLLTNKYKIKKNGYLYNLKKIISNFRNFAKIDKNSIPQYVIFNRFKVYNRLDNKGLTIFYFKGEMYNKNIIKTPLIISKKRFILKKKFLFFKKTFNFISPFIFYSISKSQVCRITKNYKFKILNFDSSKNESYITFNKNQSLVTEILKLKEYRILKYPLKLNLKTWKIGVLNWIEVFIFHYSSFKNNKHIKPNIFFHIKKNALITPNSIIFSFNFYLRNKNSTIFKITKNKTFKQEISYKLLYKNFFLNCFIEEFDNFHYNKNFILINDFISEKLKILNSGWIKTQNNFNLNIHKANIFILPKNTELKKYNFEFIKQKEILLIFFSQMLQSSDIVQGLPKVNRLLELFNFNSNIISQSSINISNYNLTLSLKQFVLIQKNIIHFYPRKIFESSKEYTFFEIGKAFKQTNISKNIRTLLHIYFLYYLKRKGIKKAIETSLLRTSLYLLELVKNVYKNYDVSIASQNFEIIIKQLQKKGKIKFSEKKAFFNNELIHRSQLDLINDYFLKNSKKIIYYEPYFHGLTKASLLGSSLLSRASSRETSKILIQSSIEGNLDFLRGIKENVILGNSSSLVTFSKIEESILKLTSLKLLKI